MGPLSVSLVKTVLYNNHLESLRIILKTYNKWKDTYSRNLPKICQEWKQELMGFKPGPTPLHPRNSNAKIPLETSATKNTGHPPSPLSSQLEDKDLRISHPTPTYPLLRLSSGWVWARGTGSFLPLRSHSWDRHCWAQRTPALGQGLGVPHQESQVEETWGCCLPQFPGTQLLRQGYHPKTATPLSTATAQVLWLREVGGEEADI